jgi:hypothetical protein
MGCVVVNDSNAEFTVELRFEHSLHIRVPKQLLTVESSFSIFQRALVLWSGAR